MFTTVGWLEKASAYMMQNSSMAINTAPEKPQRTVKLDVLWSGFLKKGIKKRERRARKTVLMKRNASSPMMGASVAMMTSESANKGLLNSARNMGRNEWFFLIRPGSPRTKMPTKVSEHAIHIEVGKSDSIISRENTATKRTLVPVMGSWTETSPIRILIKTNSQATNTKIATRSALQIVLQSSITGFLRKRGVTRRSTTHLLTKSMRRTPVPLSVFFLISKPEIEHNKPAKSAVK